MLEFVFVAIVAIGGLALIAGGVVLLVKLVRERRAAETGMTAAHSPAFAAANDFEIDYRRVLMFAKLHVRR